MIETKLVGPNRCTTIGAEGDTISVLANGSAQVSIEYPVRSGGVFSFEDDPQGDSINSIEVSTKPHPQFPPRFVIHVLARTKGGDGKLLIQRASLVLEPIYDKESECLVRYKLGLCDLVEFDKA